MNTMKDDLKLFLTGCLIGVALGLIYLYIEGIYK